MINLPTKFEVSNFTRHGNMKRVAKCRKRDCLGWLWVTQSSRQCHHSIERIMTSYSSLIETIRLSCTVLRYSLRHVQNRSILLPVWCLQPPPPTEGFAWDDLREILHGDQRMAAVHSGEKIAERFNPLSRVHQHYRQTDDRRQTDGFAIAKTRT